MKLLKQGDIIGIISPSSAVDKNEAQSYIRGLEGLGFRVKTGKNLYKDTFQYIAGTKERVEDFNDMVHDDEVKLVFFGGGHGSVDLLPYIDYPGIRESPKLFLSYSDGTSLLNAIYAQTGIITYYGQSPMLYSNISKYDRAQFFSHLVDGDADNYVSSSEWHTLTGGRCEGFLLGGYLLNFALSVGNRFFPYPMDRDYVLFIEESEKYQSVKDVGMFLTCIEQNPLMEHVKGLLFGHFSEKPSPILFGILERFGQKHQIPVAYCDDFGHGNCHAIFPVGRYATLDTREKTLVFG